MRAPSKTNSITILTVYYFRTAKQILTYQSVLNSRYKSGQNHLTDFIGIEPSKKRKRRTSFTPQALELLNAHFERNTHPSGKFFLRKVIFNMFLFYRPGDNRFSPSVGIRKRSDKDMVLQQETGFEKHRSNDVERNGVKRL